MRNQLRVLAIRVPSLNLPLFIGIVIFGRSGLALSQAGQVRRRPSGTDAPH